MAENFIDYDVLEECKTFYGQTATQMIANLIKDIDSVNHNKLLVGWRNDTSNAFVAYYEKHYKKALLDLSAEMSKLSTEIAKYSQRRQDEDAQGAASWNG